MTFQLSTYRCRMSFHCLPALALSQMACVVMSNPLFHMSALLSSPTHRPASQETDREKDAHLEGKADGKDGADKDGIPLEDGVVDGRAGLRYLVSTTRSESHARCCAARHCPKRLRDDDGLNIAILKPLLPNASPISPASRLLHDRTTRRCHLRQPC